MGGMMGMQGQMGMMGGGVMQPPMGMMGAMGGLINPATIVGDVSLLDKTGSGAAVPSGSAAPDLEELLNRLGLRDKLLPKLLENDIDSVAELRLLTEDDFKASFSSSRTLSGGPSAFNALFASWSLFQSMYGDFHHGFHD